MPEDLDKLRATLSAPAAWTICCAIHFTPAGKGNLLVNFGEPDIDILPADDGKIRVKVNGVGVFPPNVGEVHSDGVEGVACWFADTDYNEATSHT